MEIKIKDFIPKQTFECGQCFRWEKNEDDSYTGIAGGKCARISKTGDTVTLHGVTQEDYDSFFRKYLDFDRDYGKIKEKVNINETMSLATSYGGGIRLLRQEFFETLISFIISQRSSIPRIKTCVERLCNYCGDKIEFEGKTYYSFPDAKKVSSLSEREISSFGVGYRASYIKGAGEMVLSGEINGDELSEMNTPDARRELLKIRGVGDKVCDCVLLFSLGKYDLFPSDVWIKRVMLEKFNTSDAKCAGEECFGPYSGFAQQYLFYWRRENNII